MSPPVCKYDGPSPSEPDAGQDVQTACEPNSSDKSCHHVITCQYVMSRLTVAHRVTHYDAEQREQEGGEEDGDAAGAQPSAGCDWLLLL